MIVTVGSLKLAASAPYVLFGEVIAVMAMDGVVWELGMIVTQRVRALASIHILAALATSAADRTLGLGFAGVGPDGLNPVIRLGCKAEPQALTTADAVKSGVKTKVFPRKVIASQIRISQMATNLAWLHCVFAAFNALIDDFTVNGAR